MTKHAYNTIDTEQQELSPTAGAVRTSLKVAAAFLVLAAVACAASIHHNGMPLLTEAMKEGGNVKTDFDQMNKGLNIRSGFDKKKGLPDSYSVGDAKKYTETLGVRSVQSIAASLDPQNGLEEDTTVGDSGECAAKCPPQGPGDAACGCSPRHQEPGADAEAAFETCALAPKSEGSADGSHSADAYSTGDAAKYTENAPAEGFVKGVAAKLDPKPVEDTTGRRTLMSTVSGEYRVDWDDKVKKVVYACQSGGAHCVVMGTLDTEAMGTLERVDFISEYGSPDWLSTKFKPWKSSWGRLATEGSMCGSVGSSQSSVTDNRGRHNKWCVQKEHVVTNGATVGNLLDAAEKYMNANPAWGLFGPNCQTYGEKLMKETFGAAGGWWSWGWHVMK